MGVTRRGFLGCVAGSLTAGLPFDVPRRVRTGPLRDQLGVHIEAPVRLWSSRGASGVPYVDYSWPASATIRDFSRVVPLERQSEGAGEIIAWVDDLPVALRRRYGRGDLIFLGSPLGPALWAGDAEARRWLCEVVGR